MFFLGWDTNRFHVRRGFFHKRGPVELRFVIEAILEFRFRFGLLRLEDRAAILVWADGNLVCANPLGVIHDRDLVLGREGTEDREIRDVVDRDEGIEGLGSDLPDRFAGREGEAMMVAGDFLGDAQHHAPHDGDAIGLRNMLVDRFLEFRERNNVQLEGGLIIGQGV